MHGPPPGYGFINNQRCDANPNRSCCTHYVSPLYRVRVCCHCFEVYLPQKGIALEMEEKTHGIVPEKFLRMRAEAVRVICY